MIFLSLWLALALPSAMADVGGDPSIDGSRSQFLEGLLKLRDPFKMPDVIGNSSKNPGEQLERYSLDTLKVIGILTGPDRWRALVAAPDGRTFSVGQGYKIGQEGGVIRKIYEDRVVVQEKATNLAGKIEWLEIDLPLVSESSGSGSNSIGHE